jgi:hypothetical protein
MTLHVRVSGGGTADWEKPVQIGPGSYRAIYQTYVTTRFGFDDGRVVHVRARYEGVDDIELASETPVNGGFGHIEGVDEDGDMLFGRVDWSWATSTRAAGTRSPAERGSGRGPAALSTCRCGLAPRIPIR